MHLRPSVEPPLREVKACSQHMNCTDPVPRRVHWLCFVLVGCGESRTLSSRLAVNACSDSSAAVHTAVHFNSRAVNERLFLSVVQI